MKIDKLLSVFSLFVFYSVSALCSVCLCADTEENLLQEDIQMYPIPQNNVNDYPHNAVVSLEIVFQNDRYGGTGFLIGDRYVLTAAHNLFLPLSLPHLGSNLPQEILCRRERHGDQSLPIMVVRKYAYLTNYEEVLNNIPDGVVPHGEENLNNILKTIVPQDGIVHTWLPKVMKARFDLALLYLEDEINQPPTILPRATVNDLYSNQLQALYCNQPIKFCGYPGKDYDVVNYNVLHAKASLPYEIPVANSQEIDDHVRIFRTRSYRGMSGSPIRVQDASSQEWWALSILVNGNSQYTCGCLLTEEKQGSINAWRQELPNLAIAVEQNGTVFQVIAQQENQSLLQLIGDVFDNLFGH